MPLTYVELNDCLKDGYGGKIIWHGELVTRNPSIRLNKEPSNIPKTVNNPFTEINKAVLMTCCVVGMFYLCSVFCNGIIEIETISAIGFCGSIHFLHRIRQ